MNDILTFFPCSLNCDSREAHCEHIDDLHSFPDGYCFVYALAYRLNCLSHRDIITSTFPSLKEIRSRLLNVRGRVPSESLDQFDLIMSSQEHAYILEDDSLFDFTVVCDCQVNKYFNMPTFTLTSDLWAVHIDSFWHIYYNPFGTPRKFMKNLSLPGWFGSKRGGALTRKQIQALSRAGRQKEASTALKLANEARAINHFVAPKRKKGPKKPKRTGFGKWLRTAGGIAGSWLGNETLGRRVGGAVSRIFGQGDYIVRSNSLMNGGPPSFSPLNAGVRITHREYITDLFSSINYSVNTFRLQPSIETSFPWLSQLANSFEQYKINGMVVYLNTTSGNAISSTNNALGVWGVTTVYDPSRPPLANKTQAEEYVGCTAGVPSVSILHPIECKPKSDVLERYFLDYTGTVTGDSLKFYDHGLINVFTQGQQAAGINLGEMWISYDITFYNPRIQPIGEGNVIDHYKLGGVQIASSSPTGTNGTVVFPAAGSLLGTVLTNGLNISQLTFPPNSAAGDYMVIYSYGGGSPATGLNMPLSVGTPNISFYKLFSLDTLSTFVAPFPTTGSMNSLVILAAFNKTDIGSAIINIGAATGNVLGAGSAATTLDIFVIPVGFSITKALLSNASDLQVMFERLCADFLSKNSLVKIPEENKDLEEDFETIQKLKNE
jgi:hypothetical protein